MAKFKHYPNIPFGGHEKWYRPQIDLCKTALLAVLATVAWFPVSKSKTTIYIQVGTKPYRGQVPSISRNRSDAERVGLRRKMTKSIKNSMANYKIMFDVYLHKILKYKTQSGYCLSNMRKTYQNKFWWLYRYFIFLFFVFIYMVNILIDPPSIRKITHSLKISCVYLN